MFNVLKHEPKNYSETIILLAGRGCSADHLLSAYKGHNFRIISISPKKEWYSISNGNTAKSIEENLKEIDLFIKNLEKELKIERSELNLAGYSAGAVVAIQLGMISKFKSIIAHHGAIYDTNIPKAIFNTPILLFHGMKDDCFKWEERYIPMKNSLIKNNYNAIFVEKKESGHVLCQEDVEFASLFLEKNYE